MSKFSRVSLLLIVLFVLTCPSAPGVKADIYRWIDAKGILSFSNIPPVGKQLRALERHEETINPIVAAEAEVSKETTETPDDVTTAMEDDLSNADLSGADLRGAYGITPEQLATAYLDDETQLPEFNASPVYFSGASPMLESPFPDLPLFVEQGR